MAGLTHSLACGRSSPCRWRSFNWCELFGDSIDVRVQAMCSRGCNFLHVPVNAHRQHAVPFQDVRFLDENLPGVNDSCQCNLQEITAVVGITFFTVCREGTGKPLESTRTHLETPKCVSSWSWTSTRLHGSTTVLHLNFSL